MMGAACKKPIVRLGLDMGGTNIKIAVAGNGEVLERAVIETPQSVDGIVAALAEIYRDVSTRYNVERVGIGIPGEIHDGRVSTTNLPFEDTPLRDMLRPHIPVPFVFENDANCAALGEMAFGSAKGSRDLILVTIGTGVGGGIIINGQLYKGKNGVAGEIGHMVLSLGGRECPCGMRGCLEQYASASALCRDAEEAAKAAPESILYALYKENGGKISGRDVFDAMRRGCETASRVFDAYTDALAAGLDGVINIFDPDAIVLAGGVTKEGDAFLAPIRDKMHFATPIEVSELQGEAGALGASLL